MQAATTSISAFGKVPTYGDFVRHNAAGPAVRRFEDWLQRGLLQVKNQPSSALEVAYDAAPTLGFVFGGGGDVRPLTGVLRTSRDAAERRYPLVVASEVDDESAAMEPSRLTASLPSFFYAAAELAEAGASGDIEQNEFGDRVQNLENTAQAWRRTNNGKLPDDQRQFLSETTFKSFGEGLWNHFEDSSKYILFKNLIDLVASVPSGKGSSVGFSFGVRFPIDAEHATPSTAFWLAAFESLLPVPLGAVTLFWSLSQAIGSGEEWSPFFVLYFDTPTPRAFVDVLLGARSSDGVFDLEDGGETSGSDAALALPPDVGQMLEQESVTLNEALLLLRASRASGHRSTRSAS